MPQVHVPRRVVQCGGPVNIAPTLQTREWNSCKRSPPSIPRRTCWCVLHASCVAWGNNTSRLLHNRDEARRGLGVKVWWLVFTCTCTDSAASLIQVLFLAPLVTDDLSRLADSLGVPVRFRAWLKVQGITKT